MTLHEPYERQFDRMIKYGTCAFVMGYALLWIAAQLVMVKPKSYGSGLQVWAEL